MCIGVVLVGCGLWVCVMCDVWGMYFAWVYYGYWLYMGGL